MKIPQYRKKLNKNNTSMITQQEIDEVQDERDRLMKKGEITFK